jgi:hypothetical protein
VVKRCVMLLPLIGLLSAWAAVPTSPSVMVWPGVGKPFDQFGPDAVGVITQGLRNPPRIFP